MMIEIKCPCCQKHVQLILSSNRDADDNVSVLSIKEMDIEDTNKHTQEELENILFEKHSFNDFKSLISKLSMYNLLQFSLDNKCVTFELFSKYLLFNTIIVSLYTYKLLFFFIIATTVFTIFEITISCLSLISPPLNTILPNNLPKLSTFLK